VESKVGKFHGIKERKGKEREGKGRKGRGA
jgi:hypothetical protein